MKYLALLLAALAVFVFLPTAPAAGQRPTVRWEQWDVAIDVLQDGTLRVEQLEQLRVEGTARHVFREIPLDRVGSITEVQVGEPGQPYRPGYNQPGTFAVTRSDEVLRIDWWFPPTTNATRTFVASYRVSGALRVYPEGDQLYWVAVPADRPGPVETSEVVVRLPAPVPPEQLRAAAYGPGEPEQPVTLAPTEVRFAARDLPPGEAYEVRVQFPHGLVAAQAPAWQAAYDREAGYNAAVRPLVNLGLLAVSVLLLLGGAVAILLTWYTRGRDPGGVREPREISVPPSDLPPAIAGTLVDERADVQDVLATLVDLGNRGVIRITKQREPGAFGMEDYHLELLQEQPLGLRPFEKTVIGALFGGQREVRLSQVKDRWSSYIPLFQDELYAEATRRGLFAEDPRVVRERWLKRGLLLLGAALVVGFLALVTLGTWADLIWLPFLALLVVGVAVLIAAPRMPRRTRAGVVEAARWRAFGRHLAAAREHPEVAHAEEAAPYLPYAVALGVDRSWVEGFSKVSAPSPPTAFGRSGPGPIIIVGPGGWGSPGPFGPGPSGPGNGQPSPGAPEGLGWNRGFAGGLDDANKSLVDLLNAANEALSSGGGSGWSGGGRSGGGGSGGGSVGVG